jgi:hypothetical protein
LQMKMRKTSISVTNIVNREGMTDKWQIAQETFTVSRSYFAETN